jgi:hypothetical protein
LLKSNGSHRVTACSLPPHFLHVLGSPVGRDDGLVRMSIKKSLFLTTWPVYLSICLLARSCLGAARPRCIVAPGAPLERIPPASPPRFSRVVESLHLVDYIFFLTFFSVRFWAFLGKGSSKTPYTNTFAKSPHDRVSPRLGIKTNGMFW